MSGALRRDQPPPPDSRVGQADRWDDMPDQRVDERTWRVIDALLEIAESRDKTPAQVALNWTKNKFGVTAPIFGARKLQQLEQNLGSVGWALTEDEMVKLDKASAIPLPSPYNFIDRYTRKRT